MGRALEGLGEQIFELNPRVELDDGDQHSDHEADTLLHFEVGFLDVLLEKDVPELCFLLAGQVFVEGDEVLLEEDGAVLPHWPFLGVDEVVGQGADGGVMFDVGFE